MAAILKMVHRNTRNMCTMPNTGETGKSVETLRFAEMLSSFAQIPVARMGLLVSFKTALNY